MNLVKKIILYNITITRSIVIYKQSPITYIVRKYTIHFIVEYVIIACIEL